MNNYLLCQSNQFKFSLLIVFIAILSLAVFSWDTYGSVEGTVTDENGAVVPGANVSLVSEKICVCKVDCPDMKCEDNDDEKKCCAPNYSTTNEDGFFQFLNVRPGNYRVKVAATGFKASEGQVSVSADRSTTFNIVLDVGSSNQMVTMSTRVPKKCGFFCKIKRAFGRIFGQK